MNINSLKWVEKLQHNILFKYLLFITNYYFVKPSHVAGLILILTNFILIQMYYSFNELTCTEYHFTEKTPYEYMPKNVSDTKFKELAKNFTKFANEQMFNQEKKLILETILNLTDKQKYKLTLTENSFNLDIKFVLTKNFKEIILTHFNKIKTNYTEKSHFPIYILVEQRGYVPFWSYYQCKIIYRDFDQNGISLSTYIYQKIGYKFEYFSEYWIIVKEMQYVYNILENFFYSIKEPIIMGTIIIKSMVFSTIENTIDFILSIKNYSIIKPIFSILEFLFKIITDIINYLANIGDDFGFILEFGDRNFFRIFQILRDAGLAVEEIIISVWAKALPLEEGIDNYYHRIQYKDYLSTLYISQNTETSLYVKTIQFLMTLIMGWFLTYFQTYGNYISTPINFEVNNEGAEDMEITTLKEITTKETQKVVTTVLQQMEQIRIVNEQKNQTIAIENKPVKQMVYKIPKADILNKIRTKTVTGFEISSQLSTKPVSQYELHDEINAEVTSDKLQINITEQTNKIKNFHGYLKSFFKKFFNYISSIYTHISNVMHRTDPLYFWLNNILEEKDIGSSKYFIDYRWNISEEAATLFQKNFVNFARKVSAELLDNFVRIKLKDPNYELFQWGGLDLDLKIRLLINQIEQNKKDNIQKITQDIINEIVDLLTKDDHIYRTGIVQLKDIENDINKYNNYERRTIKGFLKIYDRLDQGLLSCNYILKKMQILSPDSGIIDTINQVGSEGRGLSYYLIKPKATIYDMFYLHRHRNLGKPNTDNDLYELLKDADIYDILSVEERQNRAALIKSSRKMPEISSYFNKSCITLMDTGFRLRSDVNILTENLQNIFTLKPKFSGLINPNVKFYYDKDPIADFVFFMRDSFRFFPRPLLIKFTEIVETPKDNLNDFVFTTKTMSGLVIGRHIIFSKNLPLIVIDSSNLIDLEILDYIPDHILENSRINLKNQLHFPTLNRVCSTILNNFPAEQEAISNNENDTFHNVTNSVPKEAKINITQKFVSKNELIKPVNGLENHEKQIIRSSNDSNFAVNNIQTANAILCSIKLEYEKTRGFSAVANIINYPANIIVANNASVINLEYPDLKKNPTLFPPENETEETIEKIMKKYSKTKEQLQNETKEEQELHELQMEFEIMQALAKEPGGQFAVKGYAIPTHPINRDALILQQTKLIKITDNFTSNQPALVRHPSLKNENSFFDYFTPDNINYETKTVPHKLRSNFIINLFGKEENSEQVLEKLSKKNTKNFFGEIRQHVEKFVPKKTMYTTVVLNENEIEQNVEINVDLHAYEVEFDPVERFFATMPKAKNPGKYLRIDSQPRTALHREIAEHEAIMKKSNEEFKRTHSEVEYLDRLKIQETRLNKYRDGVNKFLADRKEKEERAQQARALEQEVISYSKSKSKFSEIMSRLFGRKK